MPANYTANYALNQWNADDKVQRTDFNADNAKIDAAMKQEADARTALAGQVAKKAEQSALNSEVNTRTSQVNTINNTLAKKGNCQIYCMSYVGDGETTRTITFPHKPVIAFIMGANMFMRAIYGVNQTTANSTGGEGAGCSAQWSGNSLTWTFHGESYNKSFACNYEGQTYQVVFLADAAA